MAQDSTPPIIDQVGLTHFVDITGRNTSDNLLRTAQQHHVQLSMMADMKANILITVSSIVLTFSLRELAVPELKYAALVLAGFTLAALFLAVLAVLPKYRPLGLASAEASLPSAFNVLFLVTSPNSTRIDFCAKSPSVCAVTPLCMQRNAMTSTALACIWPATSIATCGCRTCSF